MKTQRFLRVTLAAALAVLAAFVVAVGFGGWQLQSETDAAAAARQDLVNLGTTRVGLATTELAAAQWLATPDAAHREALAVSLDAALATARVAGGTASHEAALTRAIVPYAMALQHALDSTNGDAGALLLDAHVRLTAEVMPALDRLASSRESALDASIADYLAPWILGGALLAAAVLVLLSVLLARRVRRFVNVGLVAALAAVGGIWALSLGTAVDADSATRGRTELRASQTAAAASTLSEAVVQVAAAQPSLAARATTLRQADLDVLTAAVDDLPDPTTMAAAAQTLTERETVVLSAARTGKAVTDAQLTAVAKAGTALRERAAEATQEATTSLAELGERRASAAGLIMWLVPLVGVAAATLLVVGLNQRLQEYR